jgi:hypothetical protein
LANHLDRLADSAGVPRTTGSWCGPAGSAGPRLPSPFPMLLVCSADHVLLLLLLLLLLACCCCCWSAGLLAMCCGCSRTDAAALLAAPCVLLACCCWRPRVCCPCPMWRRILRRKRLGRGIAAARVLQCCSCAPMLLVCSNAARVLQCCSIAPMLLVCSCRGIDGGIASCASTSGGGCGGSKGGSRRSGAG